MQVLANPTERMCDLDLAADLLGIRQGLLGDQDARFPVRQQTNADPLSGKAKWYNDTYTEKLRAKAEHGGHNNTKSPMWVRDLKYYQVLYNLYCFQSLTVFSLLVVIHSHTVWHTCCMHSIRCSVRPFSYEKALY
jgi:hypothetical protein